MKGLPKLEELKIPTEMVGTIYGRVSPYLHRYHEQQANYSRLSQPVGRIFGLR